MRIGGVGNEFNGSQPGTIVINTSGGETTSGYFQFTDTKYREIVVEYAHFSADPFLSLIIFLVISFFPLSSLPFIYFRDRLCFSFIPYSVVIQLFELIYSSFLVVLWRILFVPARLDA